MGRLQGKIKSVEAANTFRKIIGSSTRHTLCTLEKADGTITKPGVDTLEGLLLQHFPSSTAVKPTEYINKSITREEILNYQPDWVTSDRVRKAFHGFQSQKSPVAHLQWFSSLGRWHPARRNREIFTVG